MSNCGKLKSAGGCPVPWSEISTTPMGEWRMCCYANPFLDMTVKTHTPIEVMNSERMKRIRKAMMNGERHVYQPFCDRCIVMEEQGQTSRREKRWEHMSYTTASVIDTSSDDGQLVGPHFDHFDIKFTGNKCNLKCYMCHPYYSSGVADDWKKLGWWNGPRHLNPFKDMTKEEKRLWWKGFEQAMPYINTLNFTGGEPFLMDEYWEIIEYVIRSGYADAMELHLSSNLTELEYRGKSVKFYFSKFKRVHLQVSVDAYGPQYNYIRYPGNYYSVMDNITKIRDQEDVDIQITTVVSALSIEALPMLADHMDQLGLPHRFDNVLTEPKYMRVSSLPMSVKHKLRSILTDNCFADIVKLLDESENLEHWSYLVNHLDKLDGIHGTDWRSTFPLVGSA